MITTTPDTLSSTEDQVATYAVTLLLAGDSTDTGALTVTAVTNGTGGTVALVDGVVTFTPDANFNGPATFSYTVDDGQGGTATETATIQVGAVNDPVSVITPTSIGPFVQGEQLWMDGFSIADADVEHHPGALFRVRVTASDGYLFPSKGVDGVYIIIIGDGADQGMPPGAPLEVFGSLAGINEWFTGLIYTPSGIGTGASITIEVSDGTDAYPPAGSGGITSDIAVLTHEVLTPHVAPTGANGSFNVGQNGLRAFTLNDFGFADADGDSLAAVYFEAASGTIYYDADGGNIADALVAAGPYTAFQHENGWPLPHAETPLISAADIAAGKVFYRPAANAVGNGIDTVKFSIYDSGNPAGYGENISETYTLTVNVKTPLSAAPVLDLNGAAMGHAAGMSIVENAPAKLVAQFGPPTLIDTDSANFDGGTLGVAVIGGGDGGDRLSLLDQGTGPGQVGVAGNDVSYEGVVVGTVTGGTGSGALLEVTFNAFATTAIVQAVVGRVAYETLSNTPSEQIVLSYVLTDGDGGVSHPRHANVYITPQDDPTDALNDTAIMVENAAGSASVLLNDIHDGGAAPVVAAVDNNAAAIGMQIVLASGALLTMNANGTYSYDPNGAFNDLAQFGLGASNDTATDSFTYTLADGDTATVTVTIRGAYSVPHELKGTSGNDVITGTAFADTFVSSSGNDTMTGLGGNDVYGVNGAGDVVVEGAGGGTDKVISSITYILGTSVENLSLAGGADIDGTGNGAINTIIGNGGANRIDGGAGADIMEGKGGDDVYIVDHSKDKVIEDANGGTDRVDASVSYSIAGQHIEILDLTGTGDLKGTGNGLANIITGTSGANYLNGGTGADEMNGGAGNDRYVVDNLGDVVIESSAAGGTDRVDSKVSFTLDGTFIETLTLTGNAVANATGNGLANTIVGNNAGNVIDGGAGVDVMEGKGGNDRFVVDNAGDKVFEFANEGNDTVEASVSFTLAGQFIETLRLTGGSAINGTGNNQANSIFGNAAANTINASGGDDKIYGGGGNDILTGGAGADRFTFDSALNAASNVDSITDFSVVDDGLYLDRSVFNALASGTLSAAAFVTGSASADAASRIVYNSATGNIFYDADGTGAGAAILFAHVTAGTALTNADFIAF